MSWARVLAARVLSLFSRAKLDSELDQEVRFHLDMQIEDNLRAGMNPDEAKRAALLSFGGIEPTKEAYRERRALPMVETTARDIRYAVRTLRRSPGFTVTAVAVLSLAIGANTAMFSVLNTVLLRPLPYPGPERLAMVWTDLPNQGIREGRSAYWNIEQWRSQNRSFSDLAFFDGVSMTLTSADGAEQISGVRSSPNLFAMLGVQPLRGRIFTNEEAAQRQRLVVISHRFSQSHFAGLSDAIGASLELDGAPSRIIGILPADFHFDDADVWQPYTLYPDWDAVARARGSGFWSVLGRLRPNVTIHQAQEEMSSIARRLDNQSASIGRGRGIRIAPLSDHIIGPKQRLTLWMLTGAVFFVLLIAATNIASLSLARAASRQREISLRAALGASRARIARQMLAESLTLAVMAGSLGLWLAAASLRFIVIAGPADLPRLNELSLDSHGLAWALITCLLAGILVGLAPAMAAQRNIRRSGREAGRVVSPGLATVRTRRALVVTEFALAMILLVGAGLMVRSLWSLQRVSLGFRPERVLAVAFAPPPGLPAVQRAAFYAGALRRIHLLPGIESAGVTSEVFVTSGSAQFVTAEGNSRPGSQPLQVRSDETSDELFRTIGTPLLHGRFFLPSDGIGSQRVAMINDTMARRVWPGRDPIGQKFKLGPADSDQPWFTVTAVVGDMRRQGLENDPSPQMFEPLAQNPPRRAILLVRTSMNDPLKMAAVVRAAVRSAEKHAPIYRVTTLESQLGAFQAPRRFETWLLTGFSLMAMLLAAIGIYGLIQYSVAARTQEIGVRIAIGAQGSDVLRMIIGEALKLSLIGLGLGLAGALVLARALSGLLFGITSADPIALLAVSLLLTAVALVACYLPARRAMSLDPITALRQE